MNSPSPIESPSARTTQLRLESALYVTHVLRPQAYDEWSRSSSYYTFADCLDDLIREGFEPSTRTAREDLALNVSGLVVATYWMDAFPGRGMPTRQVEQFFKDARLDEDSVVTPLAVACADDPSNGLTDEQRLWIIGTKTFADLGRVLELDPNPPSQSEDEYVLPLEFPISRANLATVLQPRVVQLGDRLEAEGHIPYSWEYYQQVKDRAE